MFDQILQLVKEHLGNNPEISSAIPADQTDAVHQEIATQLNKGLRSSVTPQNEIGGILSSLEGNLASGGTATSAIEGGLVSSLASKFGLPPAATGAIAAALPGLLQKFAQRSSKS
jgi:hypothetical protein